MAGGPEAAPAAGRGAAGGVQQAAAGEPDVRVAHAAGDQPQPIHLNQGLTSTFWLDLSTFGGTRWVVSLDCSD
jgi:hypothetical protein